jgi:RNA exonuclease 4
VTAKELQGAPELAEVQKAAAELLQGRTLVGHGLSKDLRVLMLSHPRKAIRDTAK